MAFPDDVQIVHSDVAGTQYTGYTTDYRKLKAVRKFIVWSSLTNIKHIVRDLTRNTSDSCTSACETLLGPRWDDPESTGNNITATIVHPDDNELPLSGVDVAAIGDKKYLVTASYTTEGGVAGSGGTVPSTMSLRSEVIAKRAYVSEDESGASQQYVPDELAEGESPIKYSYVTTAIQLRIKLPFFLGTNPLINGRVLPFLGGLNKAVVTLGGVAFGIGYVRFDGISMDEFGSVVSSAEGTYRYRGYFEFTGRSDAFFEQTPTPNGAGGWNLNTMTRPSVNTTNEAQWTESDLSLPT